MVTAPSLYIPHGGSPCFFMEWTMGPADLWDRMGDWLRGLGDTIGVRPKAIVVISAHWEAPEFTVTANAHPPLIYDYYGFPEHTYRLTYPAPGDPALAEKIVRLLNDAGIAARSDPTRGLDHGVFIPFKLIYPDADIPIVQLSLKAGLDPAAHIAAGRAIESLRRDGVLIVGSGSSYHNMAGYVPGSERFDTWLTDAACAADPAVRTDALSHWQSAPAAHDAHPSEEHLIPLMVAAGAAGSDQGHRIFNDRMMGSAVSAYRFGSA
jgi:aromatic ring-opening dioxygenase catalytic subunit (LigB family)